MAVYTCIDRVTDDRNKLIAYKLEDDTGRKLTVSKEKVAAALRKGKVKITNIVLDNRGITRITHYPGKDNTVNNGNREHRLTSKSVVFARLYHQYYLQTGNHFTGRTYNGHEVNFCRQNGVLVSTFGEWVENTRKRLKNAIRTGNTGYIASLGAECPELVELVQNKLDLGRDFEINLMEALNYALCRNNVLTRDLKYAATPRTDNAGMTSHSTGRFGLAARGISKSNVHQWMISQYEQYNNGSLAVEKEVALNRFIPGVLMYRATEETIVAISNTLNYDELLRYRGF